ncbi:MULTISPECIES: RidA family protein [unclassified Bradyrhizobium]|uniref:RidA family protein n=1 Tax=unclassified Bradyrhizobium TaxID=2631580 RepID=UPI001FF762CB|nr:MULTISPECIES: RidA family protein [unclassified Bradyrhizobium]MCK1319075.1 hypothetical protein [Bradyrhizobium sp. 23]MCK1505103.1 hypothetical protein [Bradyrhizobium sp. 18]
MSMNTVRSPKVAEAPPQTWSNMKVANGYFHIAGMTGSGPKGEHPSDDTYIQAMSIFQKFKDLLEAAGGKMNDIMSMGVRHQSRWKTPRYDARAGSSSPATFPAQP